MNENKTNPIKSNLHIARHVGYWLFVMFLVVVAGIAIFAGFDLPGNWKIFVVQSGSMEPTIPVGSVVLVRGQDSYKVEDVITFLAESNANARNPHLTITHRIVGMDQTEDGKPLFITKGDANDVNDQEPVTESRVLGRAIGHIPYLGYPIAYAKTQTGFVVLIVIPATLIIYSELVKIKREVQEKMKKRKEVVSVTEEEKSL